MTRFRSAAHPIAVMHNRCCALGWRTQLCELKNDAVIANSDLKRKGA